VARALPDAPRGLKPFTGASYMLCHDMGKCGLPRPTKSARIVGEVLGKYHPHGDVPVYDGPPGAGFFPMRLPLVMEQGNFGSVDGDSPAPALHRSPPGAQSPKKCCKI